MKVLFLLNKLLEKDDYLRKTNLKDTYLPVPLHKQSQKYLSFLWKEKIYQFLHLCFVLSPAPRVFTKFLKVPISIWRRQNIILILYLDDIILIAQSQKEVTMAMNILIFLLQNLGPLNLSSNPVRKSSFREWLSTQKKLRSLLPKRK